MKQAQRALIGLVLLAGFASAQIGTNGYLKGLAYVNTHSGEYDRIGTRLQTQFTNDWSGQTRLFAAVNYELNIADTSRDGGFTSEGGRMELRGRHIRIAPVEFYLDVSSGPLDLRLGQQYIFWGSTDWINPTDVINPWDYKNLSGEVEDYRLPVMALSGTMYAGDLTIQGVVVPGFTPAQIDLPPGTTVHHPDLDVTQAQYGLRVTSYLGATDIALSTYKGFDPYPSIVPLTDVTVKPPETTFDATYEKYWMVGWDFVRSMNEFAIKGEGAYIRRADEDGDDPFIANSSVQTVLGLDYIRSDRLSFNVQGVHNMLLDYDEADETARLDSLQLTQHMSAPEAATWAISGRVAWSPIDFVDTQMIAVYNLNRKDALILGFVTWEMADALHLSAGLVLFQGPDDSPFGRMNREDKLFVELKASF
jgi:hypothetical protein